MTSEEYDALTEEEKQIKVAICNNWSVLKRTSDGVKMMHEPTGKIGYITDRLDENRKVPDYLNDLNAMHEAEKLLEGDDRLEYIDYLTPMSSNDFERRTGCFATAAQRAKAFVLTMTGDEQ